jgi:hypothetical protein
MLKCHYIWSYRVAAYSFWISKVREKLFVKKHTKQEFRTGKFKVRNLSYVIVKQEDEINIENGFAIFESPPPPENNTDDTEINTYR